MIIKKYKKFEEIVNFHFHANILNELAHTKDPRENLTHHADSSHRVKYKST